MEPFDRGNFEKEWANALEGAELAPSAALWDQIDMNLSGTEGVVYRKRFVFMRWVAAAAVIWALLTGAIGYYYYNASEQLKTELALKENPYPSDVSETITGVNEESIQNPVGEEILTNQDLKEKVEEASVRDISTAEAVLPPSTKGNENRNATYRTNKTSTEPIDKSGSANRIGPGPGTSLMSDMGEGENTVLTPSIKLLGRNIDQSSSLLPTAGFGFAGLSFNDIEFEKEHVIEVNFNEEELTRGLWAGLNFSGGAYTPVTSGLSFGTAQEDAAFVGGIASSEESLIKGSTRGYGLGLGTKVSKKLILVGGLQYAGVTSGRYLGTDSQVVAKSLDATRANFTNSGSTNSALIIDTYNFISIPLEAGYYLFDGRFSISLNPGIDTRIYVNRNTERLMSGSPDQDALTMELNPLTFWGQLSSDISYKLSDHYQVVVSPGYKLAINSFEKGADLHPALSEVTFSMRYVFGDN